MEFKPWVKSASIAAATGFNGAADDDDSVELQFAAAAAVAHAVTVHGAGSRPCQQRAADSRGNDLRQQ